MPKWPSETRNEKRKNIDWISLGYEYSETLKQWQALFSHIREPSRKIVKDFIEHHLESSHLKPFDEIILATIESGLRRIEHTNYHKSCDKKIKDSCLSNSELLGIGIIQIESGNYQSAKTAFARLSSRNALSAELSEKLLEMMLKKIAHKDKNKLRKGVAWLEESSQLKSDINSLKMLLIKDTKRSTTEVNPCLQLNKILDRQANPVILVAGMRHSGSTALYNIVRLGLKYSGKPCNSNYSEYIESNSIQRDPGLTSLIKIHEFRNDYYSKADIILTSRRDLRDTIASAKRRKFPMLERIGGAALYARFNRSLHETWSRESDYEMSYDALINTPKSEIAKIFKVIGINEDLAPFVAAEIKFLPTDKYKETLLSDTHITDPRRILTYKMTLSDEEINRINLENEDWLKKFDYPSN